MSKLKWPASLCGMECCVWEVDNPRPWNQYHPDCLGILQEIEIPVLFLTSESEAASEQDPKVICVLIKVRKRLLHTLRPSPQMLH